MVGRLLHALAEAHGTSPMYDSFPERVRALSLDMGGIFLGLRTEECFFEDKWATKEIKNWISTTAKPQMREAVVNMIYTHCSEENLKPHSNLMPTTDYNELEISVIQEALGDLKISLASDKEEKRLLACEISKVQQESLAAAFQEEDRKMRLDSQDPATWKRLRMERGR